MQPQFAYSPDNLSIMRMPPELMAEGGLAAAAQQVKGQGRDGDTMLVHMAPGEVKGLQALAMAHGGSLTINPDTGLPEAGFLQRILPMVLGAGLAMTGVGAPLAAGLVGAGYGVAKGSLKEGLMAGLGAYGGAGLVGGLTGSAAGASAAAAPGTTAFQAAQSNLGPAAEAMSASQVAQAAPIAQQAKILGEGVTGLSSQAGRAGFMKGLEATPYAGSAATSGLLQALTAEPPKPTQMDSYQRPYQFAWNPQAGAYNPSPTPGDTSERLYFNPTYTALPIFRSAEGGQIPDPTDEMTQDGGYAAGGGIKKPKARSLEGDDFYKFAHDRRDSSMRASVEQNFAKGGLGAALPPRFLSGGGDGMSDSIKANIDGKQEARLADGEFVVPADVVSHLGNGSSKAGAKKLYAMMDRIRKARTGTKRQAPEVKAHKYMPA